MVELKELETEEIEYKKSTQLLEEAIISIASILNKNSHGKIIFGVKDNGDIVGVDVGRDTLRKISRAISQNIEPKIYPKIYKEEHNNKTIIVVEFNGDDLPYFAYGKCYMRVADEDRQLSVSEIKKLIQRIDGVKWDSQMSDSTINDVNEETLAKFINKGNKANRIKEINPTKKSILEKLGVLKDKKLTNAGKYLFCDNANVALKLAVFATNDNQTFLDINRLEGNIFEMIDEGLLYIQRNIKWKVKFSDTVIEREEIPEIPTKALREAIVNSFLHCDYQYIMENSIAIFNNRIEITNGGEFLGTSSINEYVKGEGTSMCRNKNIAKIMFLSDDVEEWGTGLKRIYDECTKENIKVEFKVSDSYFKTIFYRPNYDNQIEEQKTNNHQLTEQEQTIISYLKEHDSITRREIEELLNVKERRARDIINDLIEKEIIKSEGNRKNIKYKI